MCILMQISIKRRPKKEGMGGGILKIGFINSELVPYAALHLEKEISSIAPPHFLLFMNENVISTFY